MGILNGGGNWLWGHWAGRAGVAFTQGWKTQHSRNIVERDTNWVVFCGQGKTILGNGVSVGNGQPIQMPTGGRVGVNSREVGSRYPNEKSDFDIAEVMIWNS